VNSELSCDLHGSIVRTNQGTGMSQCNYDILQSWRIALEKISCKACLHSHAISSIRVLSKR
jgi:hypothetical protein